MDPFIGEIIMFGGNFAPRSWAFCNGQLLAISSNSALFSILGTTYGGDGRTTFGLPDLRGRAPVHAGRGPGLSDRRLGAKGGVETVVLNESQMPQHTHAATSTIHVHDEDGTTEASSGAILANGASNIYSTGAADAALNAAAATTANANTGGSQAHDNMQPWATVNYIIALQGTYPSRS